MNPRQLQINSSAKTTSIKYKVVLLFVSW